MTTSIMYITYKVDLSDIECWIIKGEDNPVRSRERFCELLVGRLAEYYKIDPAYINIEDRTGQPERLLVEDAFYMDITEDERPFVEHIESELFASYEWVVSL